MIEWELLMEFLVQFELDIPAEVAESVVEDRQRAEAAAAQALADEGRLVRLWKATVGSRRIVLGLYRADSREEIDELLSALPLYEWTRTSVTPLVQHPNDPGDSYGSLNDSVTPCRIGTAKPPRRSA